MVKRAFRTVSNGLLTIMFDHYGGELFSFGTTANYWQEANTTPIVGTCQNRKGLFTVIVMYYAKTPPIWNRVQMYDSAY
jgi:hypothetical protein